MNIAGVDFLDLNKCEQLPTHRLLKYYRSKRHYMYKGYCGECCEFHDNSDDERNALLVTEYLDQVKQILDSREHVK